MLNPSPYTNPQLTLPTLDLSEDQRRIQDAVLDYVVNPKTPYLCIGGYAGTGKTTVVGHTARLLLDQHRGLQLRFLTFTGKACSVLRSKLADFGVASELRAPCSTIHSYLYWPEGTDEKDNLVFARKAATEIEGDILIVDEASMLSTKLFTDLLRTGRPMILVGDPGQLPPVNEAAFEPLTKTTLVLEKIHRQAENNPIINLAHLTRQHKPIPIGQHGTAVFKGSSHHPDVLHHYYNFIKTVGEQDTVILVPTNRMRMSENKKVRQARGFNSKIPGVGERLVCLKNTPQYRISNGQCVYVEYSQQISDLVYSLVVRPEGEVETFRCIAFALALNSDDKTLRQKIKLHQVDIANALKEHDPHGEMMFFDYGYCLTVHKAQGSEWARVAVADARMHEHQTDTDYYRYLYTAITRAKEKLLIMRFGG